MLQGLPRAGGLLCQSASVDGSLLQRLGSSLLSSFSGRRQASTSNTAGSSQGAPSKQTPAVKDVDDQELLKTSFKGSENSKADDDVSASTLADALRAASPTGKLIDAFMSPDTAASAALEEQKAEGTGIDQDVVKMVLQAVENCKPMMKVMAYKTGTKLTYVPKVVKPAEARSLAVRWILAAAWKRKEKTKAKMADCLALELLLAYQKQGSARAKRDDLHKLALENKANAMMRWW